ncbi:MAG TPA: electron transport complex subunit RsxC [Candidatus Eisenbacteria bacterium]|nr:electron transport complex subunit RsxC [Candidatus Eisenbacteria bacterium]
MTTERIELKTFGRGGVHPGTHKRDTALRPIEPMSPLPPEVWLPLVQHLGEPATPIVKKGDRVVRGQKIAEGGATGSPLHATISGKVKPIDKRPHPTLVSVESIIIARDGEEEEAFAEDPEWRTRSREEMIDRIREAGIVGLGGAAFPTYRKLNLPTGVRVDTFVLNGAECEPYLTSDHRLMLEEPAAIVEGALAMARLIGVRRVLVGVEADKMPAVEALRAAAREVPLGAESFEVVPCEVRYPQGAERQLVTALTGRTIPPRSLPTAVGVLVQNVATAHAVHHALRYRRPLLDRILTVSGPGVLEPKNLRVPIGTLLQAIVDACGGMRPDTSRLIAGGPMMGRALPRLDLPVVKGMNGLLLLTGPGPMESGFGPCIQCARCLDACPLGLEPDQVSVRVEAGKVLDTETYGPLDCYECGCCTYVCPSARPLLQFMQVAKSALRRAVEVRAKP